MHHSHHMYTERTFPFMIGGSRGVSRVKMRTETDLFYQIQVPTKLRRLVGTESTASKARKCDNESLRGSGGYYIEENNKISLVNWVIKSVYIILLYFADNINLWSR